MFRVNEFGFHVDFPNGYQVSVSFGPGNYSEHRNTSPQAFKAGGSQSRNAEVWVARANDPVRHQAYDKQGNPGEVMGYVGPVEVAEILAAVAALPEPAA